MNLGGGAIIVADKAIAPVYLSVGGDSVAAGGEQVTHGGCWATTRGRGDKRRTGAHGTVCVYLPPKR